MPFAPQTINIRYGTPSNLLALAGQTGVAQNQMNNYQTQYGGYLRKLGLDQAFTEDELNRQATDAHFRSALEDRNSNEQAQLDAHAHAQDVNSALQQAMLDLKSKTAAGQQKIEQEKVDAMNARLDAQKSGAISSGRGRSGGAVDLVNPDGTPYVPPEKAGYGVIQNTDTGEVTQSMDGSVSDFNAEGNVLQGPSGRSMMEDMDTKANAANQPSAPPQTRQQYMQNQRLSAAKENLATREAAINARAANRQPPMTVAQRDAAHREADATALQGVLDSGDPAQITNTANSDLWRQGAMMFQPTNPTQVQKATAMLTSHVARLRTEAAALSKPITNSQGTTPMGGNVVTVQTPADAAKLPPGTIYMAPDGVIRRIP